MPQLSICGNESIKSTLDSSKMIKMTWKNIFPHFRLQQVFFLSSFFHILLSIRGSSSSYAENWKDVKSGIKETEYISRRKLFGREKIEKAQKLSKQAPTSSFAIVFFRKKTPKKLFCFFRSSAKSD
jgi:hypothetical protein